MLSKMTRRRISFKNDLIHHFLHLSGLNLSSCIVPPKIQRGPRVMKVQAGHRVDIPCSAQGIPPPTVTWFRGRSAVLIDGRQFTRGLDGALSISNIQLPDAGIYKCVASNAVGSDTSEITLQVQGISARVIILPPALSEYNVMPVLSGLFFGGQCPLLSTVT